MLARLRWHGPCICKSRASPQKFSRSLRSLEGSRYALQGALRAHYPERAIARTLLASLATLARSRSHLAALGRMLAPLAKVPAARKSRLAALARRPGEMCARYARTHTFRATRYARGSLASRSLLGRPDPDGTPDSTDASLLARIGTTLERRSHGISGALSGNRSPQT